MKSETNCISQMTYNNGVIIGVELITELFNVIHQPQFVLIDIHHKLMESLRFYRQVLLP